jgi:hypothetical protein
VVATLGRSERGWTSSALSISFCRCGTRQSDSGEVASFGQRKSSPAKMAAAATSLRAVNGVAA